MTVLPDLALTVDPGVRYSCSRCGITYIVPATQINVVCVSCNANISHSRASLASDLAFVPVLAHDPVSHPSHYTSHPSGTECITITEAFNFNLGNAIKYIWRAGLKDATNATTDLRKAAWYLDRELSRLAKL